MVSLMESVIDVENKSSSDLGLSDSLLNADNSRVLFDHNSKRTETSLNSEQATPEDGGA